MGCVGSKVQDEAALSRCRQGKRHLRRAMKSHNALAIAHTDYLAALRSTGTAFRTFAEFEFKQQQRLSPHSPSPAHGKASPDGKGTFGISRMAYQNTPLPSDTVIMSIPPMADQSVPFVSETVVMSPVRMMSYQPTFSETVVISPPRSPEDQRSWGRYFNYQDYLSADAPPPEVYNSAPTPPSHSEPSTYQSTPPSPPPPIFSFGWDWLDLFRSAPMPVIFQEPGRYKQEEPKQQVMTEDEIPPLEVERTEERSPPQETCPPQRSPPHKMKKEQEEVEVEKGEAKKPSDEKTEDNSVKVSEWELEKEPTKENVEECSHENEERSLAVVSLEPEETPTKKVLEPILTKVSRKSRNMLELLTEMDVQFSRAAESGKTVTKVLEASKIHCYSSFGNFRGFADHSSRFFSSVSRGYWSPRTPLSSISSFSTSTASEDSTAEDPAVWGNHGSTLDKLYAWERKLYTEVKRLERCNKQFERKGRRLQRLLDKGEGEEKIEKARASRKAFETEVIVAGQAMDETISSIRNLIDDELYPQLLQLLEGSAMMWKEMWACHQYQREAVSHVIIPDELTLETTSYAQRQATQELESVLDAWLKSFSAVMSIQRDYMRSLNMWLSISLFRQEREPVHRVASLHKRGTSRIHILCQKWQRALDKLPEKTVINALKRFSEIARHIVRLQEDEYIVKKKVDSLTKEMSRKVQALHNAERRHGDPVLMKKGSSKIEEFATKNSFDERREELERLKTRVDVEKERYNQTVRETRSSTLRCLKEGLPQLFAALTDFSLECLTEYQSLYSQARNGKLVNLC